MFLTLKVHSHAGNTEEDAPIPTKPRRGFGEDEVRTDNEVSPGHTNASGRDQHGVLATECLRPKTIADVIKDAGVSWSKQHGQMSPLCPCCSW